MHFVTFFYYIWNVLVWKLIGASNRAGWAVDPYGLSPTLSDSNMLEHNHHFAKPWVSGVLIVSSTWN